MFDTDQLNGAMSVSSSYQKYPANKPFINTEWTRSNQPGGSVGASKAFPESNRDGNFLYNFTQFAINYLKLIYFLFFFVIEIISSLKKLQEKLFRLEMDQKSDNQQQSNNFIRRFRNPNEDSLCVDTILILRKILKKRLRLKTHLN